MSRIKLQPNWWDRLVGVFSPAWALRNAAIRGMMASGSYHGASSTSTMLRSWNPGGGSADADALYDLPTLRERSRDAERNEPLAGAYIRTKVSNVIGRGLNAQSTPDAALLPKGTTPEAVKLFTQQAEAVWGFHTSGTSLDFERRASFGALSGLAAKSTAENGDTIALLRMRPSADSPLQTAVHLIEADRLSNPRGAIDGSEAPDRPGSIIAGGVERNPRGVPVGYWIQDQHPGDIRLTHRTWRRVSARGSLGQRLVLHMMKQDRIGQSRGVPDLARVLERLHTLTGFDESALQAALVNSFFAAAVTNPHSSGFSPASFAGASGETVDLNDNETELNAGQITFLKPGQDIKMIRPEHPASNYEPFVTAQMKVLSACLGVGMEVLLQHFGSSYSAARAELLSAWRFFWEERDRFIAQFAQPVWEAVIEEGIGLGLIDPPPGFFDSPLIRYAWLCSVWHGPAPVQLDPVKEATAAKIMCDEGFATRQESTANLTGGDWATKHPVRVREEQMRRAGGLSVEDTAERIETRSAVMQPGGAPPPEDPATTDDEAADDEEAVA